jgi:hypothetical protein
MKFRDPLVATLVSCAATLGAPTTVPTVRAPHDPATTSAATPSGAADPTRPHGQNAGDEGRSAAGRPAGTQTVVMIERTE